MTTCPACSAENLASNRFCGGCGAPLARRCPAYAHTNPFNNRFCGECGADLLGSTRPVAASPTHRSPASYTPEHLADRILQSKSALEDERKQVTDAAMGATAQVERLAKEIG